MESISDNKGIIVKLSAINSSNFHESYDYKEYSIIILYLEESNLVKS